MRKITLFMLIVFFVFCSSCKKRCPEFDKNLKEKYFPNYTEGNNIYFENIYDDTLIFNINVYYSNAYDLLFEKGSKACCEASFELNIKNFKKNIVFNISINKDSYCYEGNCYHFAACSYINSISNFSSYEHANVTDKEYKNNIAIFGDTIIFNLRDNSGIENSNYIKVIKDIGIAEFSLNDTVWSLIKK